MCFRDTVCKELHSKYVDACEETVAEHAQCTNDCRNAYRAFVKVRFKLFFEMFSTSSISFPSFDCSLILWSHYLRSDNFDNIRLEYNF